MHASFKLKLKCIEPNILTHIISFLVILDHLEAAHILQYTEDEFLQILDWRPHAKADFHICKSKKDNTISTNDMPNIEENESNEKENDDDDESHDGSSLNEDSNVKPCIEEEEIEN